MTVKFLGEVPEDRVGEVAEIASAAGAASRAAVTSLTDVGAFLNLRRARVLWVGMDDPGGAFAALASSMEERFGVAGFRKEGRALHVHLTLARFHAPQPVEKELLEAGPYNFDRSPFDVAEIVLFRSRLSPKGATYEEISRFPLP